MKQFYMLLCLIIICPIGCDIADSKGVIKLVTVEEFKELDALRDVQLLDIRTPEEYKSGYIEGYRNMDYLSDTFKEEMETLDKSKPIVIYCRSGGRSGRCATLMLEIGFKEIYDLEGGIIQWKAENNPVIINSEN